VAKKLAIYYSVAEPGCLSQVPDPGSEFFHPGSGLEIRIRIQAGQNWPPKQEKKGGNFMFEDSERPL
jgi:hypothetical protein